MYLNQKKYIHNLSNEQKENIKNRQQIYYSNHKIESRLKTAKRRANKKIGGGKLSKGIIKKLYFTFLNIGILLYFLAYKTF
jgi:hypothetical protein